jgi:ureidoglycolate lyase
MRVLTPQPLTAAAFARYGQVIDTTVADTWPVNGGSSRRHEALPAMDLQRDGGRAVLAVYDALARTWPFEARVLERHRLSEQVFLPLGGARRCVLLVAPAGAPPRPEDCEAFVTSGHQGVSLAAGTWHHGLLALDDGPWAVLERRARDGVVDCDEHALATALTLRWPPA